MQGLGNDFIILDSLNQKLPEYSELAKEVCNRHFGIGADGMIVVEESSRADIKMVYFNRDGTQGEMCGNGLRCFARFVYEKKYIDKEEFTVETLAGIMKPRINVKDGVIKDITINMGKPIFFTELIPIASRKKTFINEKISVKGKVYNISFIFMGCPHVIIFVDDINTINVEKEGAEIEKLPLFPQGTNVNFCSIIDNNNIYVVTWERGVGKTLACGTGATAVGVIATTLYGFKGKINVHLLGGKAVVELKEERAYLTGPAEFICEGEYYFKYLKSIDIESFCGKIDYNN